MSRQARLVLRLAIPLLALLIFVTPVPVADACIWDTRTLQDELQTQAATFDLITGQFPHHGSAYYESRVKTSRAEIKDAPEDVEPINDLAVALLKLGRFDEALVEFDRIDLLKPNLYETHSNRGVLFKKRGDYLKASASIALALDIKPEGHLGLGDFYLKMLKWMQATSEGQRPEESFLGVPYDNEEGCEFDEDCLERLEAMIRSDRTFSDALFVLADTLAHRSYLNLALWAYVRAKELGHPRPDLIERRISAIFVEWRASAGTGLTDKQIVEDQAETVMKIASELESAQVWLKSFEEIEGELIGKAGDTDFAEVEAEMSKRSIHRKVAKDVGVRSAKWFERTPWYLWVLAFCFLGAVFLLLRRRTGRKALRAN